MKKIILLLLSACLFFQESFAADTTPSSTPVERQYKHKEPDFSPPTDLKGPVFPPEEFIGEPPPDTDRFISEAINMMATLGLIISLILLVAWFLKRMLTTRQEQANTSSIIKVIERRPLSPKSAIYLLEIEGKSLIIAESVNGVTALTQYNSPEDIEEEEPKIPSSFNKLLDKPTDKK